MKKDQLPVSRRFYNDISLRINNALSAAPVSAAEAMRIVDSYMDGESPESDDPMAILAFNMIKDEIDRAMTRSQRARARARIRKGATKNETLPATEKITEKNSEEEPAPAPASERPKSRRERRAALNLMRRLSKPRWGAIQ